MNVDICELISRTIWGQYDNNFILTRSFMFWILSKTDEQGKLGCFYTEKWALRPGETKVQGYHPHFHPLFQANPLGGDGECAKISLANLKLKHIGTEWIYGPLSCWIHRIQIYENLDQCLDSFLQIKIKKYELYIEASQLAR